MAESIKFEGCNCTLSAPSKIIGLKKTKAGSTDAFSDGKNIVTCWRLSTEELAEIAQTGLIWMVVQGQDMPQTIVSARSVLNIRGMPSIPNDPITKQGMN